MSFTRLRFRGTIAPAGHNLPGTTESSAVLPVETYTSSVASGSFQSAGWMTHSTGSDTSYSGAHASLAQTAAQDIWATRKVSDGLAAQTIPAGNWTVMTRAGVTSAALSAYRMFSIYIWRPSTSSVVGYIYDSHTSLGALIPASPVFRGVTVAGNAITVQSGDRLVVETWFHATSSMATSYSVTTIGGISGSTGDATDGATVSTLYPWIDAPATVYYVGETVPSEPPAASAFTGWGIPI